ncbi:autoinducer binding domain-containing protein [Burkholderia cenocepacia]|uniref:autoinducer binding domain-containing protein n=1 Tax=Burkholderia cenocepacia TaxID=95486 RepID=UPI001B9A734D|nr:autoinducer binding domain-containing protein [Burkholderia cenocepacia]MBR8043128.1 autoinducer binding domain-containing protein [Burkholderia cenocepacia]MBR8324502.1 autoinducer binding domain-containing protein [Burkholderia cenocepacia]
MTQQDEASCNLLSKLYDISRCRTDYALAQTVQAIAAELGGYDYLYIQHRRGCEPDQMNQHQYLIGCDPQWPQVYLDKKWYVNDPDLMWALRESQVTVASNIKAETEGQRNMRRFEQAHGFRSKLIVPVHSPGSKMVGVLYVGTPDVPEIGEPLLLQHRIEWRSLAAELLDWFEHAYRTAETRDIDLTQKEVTILNFLKHDYAAPAIAHELNVSVPTVHSYYKKLNQKFKVQHISLAVKIALHLGILG